MITEDNMSHFLGQLKAISPSVSVNDTIVSVLYTNGTSAQANKAATVTIFKYLMQSGSYNPIARSPPRYGYYGYAYYSIYSRPGAFAVTSSGRIVDLIGIDSPAPLPPNLQIVDDQTIAVEGIYVRDNTITFSASTAVITNSGPTDELIVRVDKDSYENR